MKKRRKQGLARKRGWKLSDFDQKRLNEGAQVELEHTDSLETAKHIAADHLIEDPNYYEKLKKAGL